MVARFFFTNEKTDNRFFQYVLGWQPSDGIMLMIEREQGVDIHVLLDARYVDRTPEVSVSELQKRVGKQVTCSVVLRQRDRLQQLQEITSSGDLIAEASLPLGVLRKIEELFAVTVEDVSRSATLRLRKTEQELEQLRQAQQMTLQVLAFVEGLVQSGAIVEMSELEARGRMLAYALSLGAEDESFPAIVATGAHSAVPHWQTSRSKIMPGPLLVDCGYRVTGYCGDCTRVFRVGEPHGVYHERHEVVMAVQDAQKAAIRLITSGVSVQDVDNAARNVLHAHGLDEFFTHSLGHGVGLDIHEGPRVSQYADDLLRPTMVITVEPGVYLPGKFGVRWEDVVEVSAV